MPAEVFKEVANGLQFTFKWFSKKINCRNLEIDKINMTEG